MFSSKTLALTVTARSTKKWKKKKQYKSYKSKQDCWSVSKHQPLKQGDSQCFLLVNNLVEDWRLLLARKCEFSCVCVRQQQISKHCVFWLEGGTLPSQGIPNALKNVELRASLPNTLALVLYLSLCQTICGTSLTQPLFSRANRPSLATQHQWCKSALVLKEWGGSSAWSLTAPLNSAGLVIKWLDEWAISVCQLLAWPGELGRCQTEWRPTPYK